MQPFRRTSYTSSMRENTLHSMNPPQVPRSDWTRELVPTIIDRRATLEPAAIYAEYPVSTTSYEDGYRSITYKDLANAVNGIAWWLQQNIGPGKDNVKEALAYMGPNDIRYPALIVGAAKVGYMMFLTSPRNSVAAQKSLFEHLNCKTIVSPNPRPIFTTALLGACKLNIIEVPSVEDLLGKEHHPFPFDKAFEDALSEPFFAVHTSGSTGIPKPLLYTHGFAAKNMKMMTLNPPSGFESQHQKYQGKRVFLTFPPFHGAYLASHLFNAVPNGTIMIAPISGSVPSAHGLVEGLKRTPAEVAFIVPSIVQELSQNLDLLDYCAKHLEMILYCGGDLPQSIGDVVASRIPLFNQFGASELGLCAHVLPTSHRDPQDWGYIEFHPEMGVDLRHVTEGMHELYIKRNPELEEQQPSFALFPDQQEYSSRDLFVRHRSESKPNLWRWKARADDIIVFLNGEKTNPISMEQHISSRSPEVSAALVTGAQRFQAALLIETTTGGKELSPLERATLIEELWPIIEEANRDCPAHARIAKTHILFTHFDKPMARAGKGTVQRAGTLQLYANEIDALYADADTMLMANEEEHGVRLIDPSDTQAVSRFMKEVVLEITSWSALDDTVDLLSLGIDSLQILTLVRKLRKGLQLQSIAPSTIYKSPSIAMLADAILRLFEEQLAEKTGHAQSRLEERASLLKEFEDKIDQLSINLSRMVNGTPASNIVSLPRQPLPTLNATLELYLDSAKPFLSKLEFKKTSNVIRDFAEGIVEHLQKRLENREQDPEIDNWQHDLQVEGIYLKRRDPIHPYGIFYGVHLPVDVPHSQSERAAVICLAVSKFKRLLGSGKAEQETLNEEPLCMNTLQYLFNTNREPRLNIDIVQKYPGKSYIVVIRRGHAFKLMTDERTTLDSLKLNFDAILRASEQDILPVASLTIDERNSWAILREEVQKVDASNKATLATIEAAAFIVCLDDEAPSTPSERCNQFLIGNPSNRWADKSLQFIICSNGVSGYICEHSMLDAISIKQLNNHVTEAIQRYNPEPQLHSTVPQGFIEELTFKTTAAIESQIYKVSSEFRTKHSLRLEFSHYSITTATPAFFSSHRIPAKPGCQLIIQLASLLHFGIQYPAWEVVTLAPFLKGRLDWMQVVSPAMHAFCSAASSTTIPVSEQRRLLKEAIRSHTATLIRISRGKGFAAHLEALQQVLRQDEEVPEVFRDSSWQWMRVTASRKLKTDASDGMLIQEAGYLMPDPKSLFLHYEAIKGGWKFFVQGTEGVTERFCLALEKAAEVVRRVVESGCEEGG